MKQKRGISELATGWQLQEGWLQKICGGRDAMIEAFGTIKTMIVKDEIIASPFSCPVFSTDKNNW